MDVSDAAFEVIVLVSKHPSAYILLVHANITCPWVFHESMYVTNLDPVSRDRGMWIQFRVLADETLLSFCYTSVLTQLRVQMEGLGKIE